MFFNQNFVPGWNAIYSNILNKVNRTILSTNEYTSPFTQMLQDMETGEYIEDIHINPGRVLLQDTITNSDIFTDYTDDLAAAVYEVNVDLVFPSTYLEYVVREGATVIENVSALIAALAKNIRTTVEYTRNNQVKQMLYNAYQYGMIDSVVIDDPAVSPENSGKLAVALNTLIDDFSTEINSRNVIFNNMTGLDEDEKRLTISRELPYVIIFNNYIRDAEFFNAINLGLIEKFKTGDNNQDFANKIIRLNADDFPTSIPTTNRSDVTGQNVDAKDINFFEMPTDKNGVDLFSGVPKGEANIAAFVLSPSAIKLFTQLSIMTSWLNPGTLKTTNREIYRGIMQLSAFSKICAVTFA